MKIDSVSSLAKKLCIVTGGSRGIGLAVAQRFVTEGADVLLLARSPEMAVLEQLRPFRTYPEQHFRYLSGDVANQDTWDRLAKLAPKVDVLVNCAGISQKKLLLSMAPSECHDIVNTNLNSAILGSRYAVKAMIRGKTGGCIINVSSALARKGIEGTSVYAASKAGLLGLTSSLAVEYGKYNIRVNALVPGYITTSMTEDVNRHQNMIEKIPLRRFGTVQDAADAVAFLATNTYANNCILNLDGGFSAT